MEPIVDKALVEKLDGNLDVEVDSSDWTDKKKWSRLQSYLVLVNTSNHMVTFSGLQLQYSLRFLQTPRLPVFKFVREYLNNGRCSVAKTSCKRCIEINSVRPSGAEYPPFSCLIETLPEQSRVRTDGSQICACCYVLGQTKCRAWGAYDLSWQPSLESPEASMAGFPTDEDLFGDAIEPAN